MKPGLVGKVPAAGDFVRLNAADPVATAFHRWLEQGHEAVRTGNGRLPREPLRFLFTAGADKALVGTLAPSSDKVGRQFPLALFTAWGTAEAARGFPGAPEAFSAFFSAAGRIFADAPTLPLEGLGPAVNALPCPGASDFARGDQSAADALANVRVSDLQTLFEGNGGLPGGHCYALRTFASACQGQQPLTLDCPLSAAVGPAAWLALASRLHKGNGAPPALLWSSAVDGRLLLTLGPPPATALVSLVKAEPPLNKVWPLRTQKAPAIDAARDALTPSQRSALESPATSLAQLAAAFAA